MKVLFCEFCSTVMQEEAEYCNVCGCHLVQSEDAERFNDPAFPWPFTPVKDITLQIQGCPRKIHFEGTHSLYHLWLFMSEGYNNRDLYFRVHNDEIELVRFPRGRELENFRLLEPGDILNCTYSRFSCYSHDEPDPELELAGDMLVKNYHGSFDILECPEKDIPLVLGWLLATGPKARSLEGWTYDI